MRRLVVISGKSKIIAIFAATVFSLTSMHLAAKAHIASLQREQEQFERSVMQDTQSAPRHPAAQLLASPATVDQKVTAAKTQTNQSTVAPASIDHSTNPPPDARSLSALLTVNWP